MSGFDFPYTYIYKNTAIKCSNSLVSASLITEYAIGSLTFILSKLISLDLAYSYTSSE